MAFQTHITPLLPLNLGGNSGIQQQNLLMEEGM